MNDTPSRLEQWFERVFNDDEPANIGSGWWPGVASVFFGASPPSIHQALTGKQKFGAAND